MATKRKITPNRNQQRTLGRHTLLNTHTNPPKTRGCESSPSRLIRDASSGKLEERDWNCVVTTKWGTRGAWGEYVRVWHGR